MGKQDRIQQTPRIDDRSALSGERNDDALLTPSLIRDATTLVLAAIAIFSWFAAHIGETWSGVPGLAFIICGIGLGIANPFWGLALALATAPFQGGPVGGFFDTFGVSEFARAAPLWGSVARTLVDLIRKGRGADAPPRILVVAAVAALILAPITRLPSEAYPAYQAGAVGIFVDMLAIIGSQSVMWGAWIVAAHLSREHLPNIEKTFAIVLPIALVIALVAFFKIPLFEQIAFLGAKGDRLAGLGFPTPTAMGVAVALPVATIVAWRLSRSLGIGIAALGLFVIYLTGSRGPLIASLASAALAAIIAGNVPRRIIALGGAVGALAAGALGVQRYGALVGDWISGKSVELINLSDSLRIKSWVAAFEIAIAKPFTGAGWMGLRFWDKAFDENHVAESHNIVLHALAAGGIPFALATGIGVIGSALSMWRNRTNIPIEWVAAATALLVCGLWDMPQTRAFAAIYGGVALGVVARRHAAREPQA